MGSGGCGAHRIPIRHIVGAGTLDLPEDNKAPFGILHDGQVDLRIDEVIFRQQIPNQLGRFLR